MGSIVFSLASRVSGKAQKAFIRSALSPCSEKELPCCFSWWFVCACSGSRGETHTGHFQWFHCRCLELSC